MVFCLEIGIAEALELELEVEFVGEGFQLGLAVLDAFFEVSDGFFLRDQGFYFLLGGLNLKLQLKRLGDADFKAENQLLIQQVTDRITDLFKANGLPDTSPGQRRGKDTPFTVSPEGAAQNLGKADKKQLAALQKDAAALAARLAKTDALFAQVGGKLTDEEAKTLILKKLHDLATHELNRYLNTAKRQLIQSVETLWDKYAVSSRALEAERIETLTALDGFLTGLGYLK